jgi:DNA gyrase/topoisomerase IV subunit A
VGAEILPTAGEVFLVTTEGKAKRVEQKEFPAQGRYGKGVTAWSLSGKARLAGTAVGKGNAIVAVHLAKSAPRAHHLEEAGIRKRAASRGERLFAMKPGEDVTAITSAWSVERFIKIEKPEQKSRLRTPHAAAKRSAQKASRAGAKTARPSAKRRPKGATKRKSRKK